MLNLIFAHGAGASSESPFMTRFSDLMETHNIHVIRFDFAYMAARQSGGPRRPPPSAHKLTSEFLSVIETEHALMGDDHVLFIGGKSMGGRVATLLADHEDVQRRVAGIVCVGYPFHPRNKPDRIRTEHLANLEVPTVIVQGERDPLGNKPEVAGYQLADTIQLAWVGDGDHDLKPRKKSGLTHEENLRFAAAEIAEWMHHVARVAKPRT